jgi:hypothetical protein
VRSTNSATNKEGRSATLRLTSLTHSLTRTTPPHIRPQAALHALRRRRLDAPRRHAVTRDLQTSKKTCGQLPTAFQLTTSKKHGQIRKSEQLPIQLAAERGYIKKGTQGGMERSERQNEKRNESALHRIYLASLPPQ